MDTRVRSLTSELWSAVTCHRFLFPLSYSHDMKTIDRFPFQLKIQFRPFEL
jgi:hypothetical protein